LSRDKTKLAVELDKVEKKLSNPAFTDKAPPEVVEEQRSRRQELKTQLEKVDKSLAEIPA
jgi:valyl-tRNA synthetase